MSGFPRVPFTWIPPPRSKTPFAQLSPQAPHPLSPFGGSHPSSQLPRRREPSVRVVLGAHSLEQPEESQQVFGVEESIAHPLYNPRTVDNDIRMLRVSPAPGAAGWAGDRH